MQLPVYLPPKTAYQSIQLSMSQNKLKLNHDKTEFPLIGTPSTCKRAALAQLFFFDLLGASMLPSNSAKSLGVIFYSDLTFTDHVSEICRACMFSEDSITQQS